MSKRKVPVVDAEVVARKVAAMTLGRAAAHRERLAAQKALLERLPTCRSTSSRGT
jgi:hypothetical protein